MVGVVAYYMPDKLLPPEKRSFLNPFFQMCQSLLAIRYRFAEKPGCYEWGFVLLGRKRFLDLLENLISVLIVVCVKARRRVDVLKGSLVDVA